MDQHPRGETLHWTAKAARYQMYQGLALIMVAISLAIWPDQCRLLASAGWCFVGGTLLFSGSLNFMAFTGMSAGYLTPVGGMYFLKGWPAMGLAGLRLTPPPQP